MYYFAFSRLRCLEIPRSLMKPSIRAMLSMLSSLSSFVQNADSFFLTMKNAFPCLKKQRTNNCVITCTNCIFLHLMPFSFLIVSVQVIIVFTLGAAHCFESCRAYGLSIVFIFVLQLLFVSSTRLNFH